MDIAHHRAVFCSLGSGGLCTGKGKIEGDAPASLLGDAKLIEMNQMVLSFLSSEPSLFHSRSWGFKASKKLMVFTPIQFVQRRLCSQPPFSLVKAVTRLTFSVLVLQPNSPVGIQTKTSLVS